MEPWVKQLLDNQEKLLSTQLELDKKVDRLISKESKNSTDIAWLKSAGKATLGFLVSTVIAGISAVLAFFK